MKKRTIILLLILPLILTSCSELITVLARITNIDSEETELKLHFDFKRMYKEELSKVNRIEIYRNDSLICNLYSKTAIGISEWDFPSIPKDFEIGQSISDSTIPLILKTQDIRFEFVGGVKFPGYGTWEYKSKYSKPENRWLFDNEGNKIFTTDIYYEPRIGKDMIVFKSNDKIQLTDSMLFVRTSKGQEIEFELKTFNNPTSKFALLINTKTKTKDTLYFEFRINAERMVTEELIVPNKMEPVMGYKYSDIK